MVEVGSVGSGSITWIVWHDGLPCGNEEQSAIAKLNCREVVERPDYYQDHQHKADQELYQGRNLLFYHVGFHHPYQTVCD